MSEEDMDDRGNDDKGQDDNDKSKNQKENKVLFTIEMKKFCIFRFKEKNIFLSFKVN